MKTPSCLIRNLGPSPPHLLACSSSCSCSCSCPIMTAPLSLVRSGHFFFTPTPYSTPLSSPAPSPFSTPLSSPRAWNSVNHGIEISIYDALFASPPAITGPLGDTGGPTAALEDEVVEAVHRPHCGCYWCNRWAYLLVHFARPDATPDEPAKIQPKSVAAKIQPTSVAAKIRCCTC